MRISDWSSDVCSSDLRRCARADGGAGREDAGVSDLAVRLDWSDLDDAQRAAALARPTRTVSRELRAGVAAILDQVRARGDAALRELTLRLDGADLGDLFVDKNGRASWRERGGKEV